MVRVCPIATQSCQTLDNKNEQSLCSPPIQFEWYLTYVSESSHQYKFCSVVKPLYNVTSSMPVLCDAVCAMVGPSWTMAAKITATKSPEGDVQFKPSKGGTAN